MTDHAVVRVYATTQRTDYDSPWQSPLPRSGTGSGVVVAKNRILTGAHVVANATFLQVQKVADPNKVVARVHSVCHDCDLALLEVDEPGFTDGIGDVELGEIPSLRDRISVVGYPVGGDEISVTEGVVSRVEIQTYSHSQRDLLAVTIDAAINAGNSGGPVYDAKGRVVGIAFQTLNDAENIGEAVPASLIRRFLDGVERGTRLDVPGLGVKVQNLENTLQRKRLRMAPEQSGVLVISIEYGTSAHGHLEVGDVLLEIDGLPISNNGTVRYRDRFRTQWSVVLGQTYVGDTLALKILRAGQVSEVEIELRELCQLVPRNRYVRVPTYFVYGGMVFQRLTRDFLRTWRRWWNEAPTEFLHYYYAGLGTEERQEIVILTKVLADEINLGYSKLYSEAVVSVNGEPTRNMKDFVRRIDEAKGQIELVTSRDGVIVFDADEARAANARILERYRIPRDRSPDLEAST
jgi:S1-C subfamily serine protease